jgi:hypothetical protein
MKKRIGLMVAVMLLLAVAVSAYAAAAQDVGIQVDGETVELDVMPFIENDRTLVPLRGIFEKLGATVDWEPEGQVVKVDADGVAISLAIGKDIATVIRDLDGEQMTDEVQLDVPAKLVDDRTFVPARFIAETLGATVLWDNVSRTVIIQTPEQEFAAYETVELQDIEDNEALYSWYQENYKVEGFHSIEDDGQIYVLAAAGERPTGGYQVIIDRVYFKTPEKVFVEAGIIAPAPDQMVTQALTYPNALIKLDKDNISEADGRFYNMTAGSQTIVGEVGPSLEEMEKAIPLDKVQKMVMYSLMGDEVKTFEQEEIDEIIKSLNTSPTYNGPYIMMLAGNSIKIALGEDSELTLTSYGYEEHVIVSGEVDGVRYSYCVVSPEVGGMLLDVDETEE